MTLANMDIYFHMLNHYKKIKQAKAVVDCSSPKGFQKKNCSCKQNRTTQCNIQHQPPHCPARNFGRTHTPDFILRANICGGQLHERNRCPSAPPACKRNDSKESRSRSREKVEQFRNCPAFINKERDSETTEKMNERKRESKEEHRESTGKMNERKRQSKEEYREATEKMNERKRQSKGEYKSKEDVTQEVKTSDPQEYEYVHFLLVITEDILRNNIYDDKELNKLFESHIQANINRLNEDEMRQQIKQLKKELNLPLSKRLSQCYCDDEKDKPKPENLKIDQEKASESTVSGDEIEGEAKAGKFENVKASSSTVSGDETEGEAKARKLENVINKIQEMNAETEQDVTCEEIQCCPVSEIEAATPVEDTKTDVPISSTEIPKEQSITSSVDDKKPPEIEPKPPEIEPEDVLVQETLKDKTCEELSCCPVEDSVASQQKTQDENLDQAKLINALGSLKNQEGCLDRNTCFSDHEAMKISKKTNEQVSSMHSLYKIIHKNDPKRTESYIIYYNPNEAEETCTCSTTLQKTALKIQSDDIDATDEYILVDGPVCMPRSWLDTRTIPVLVQNASSMLVDDVAPKEPKEGFTYSKVNLFQQVRDDSTDFDNYDSVSFQINKGQVKGTSDYDLTPQRDIVVTNNKNLGPILKKSETEEFDDFKDSKQKSSTKNMVKLPASSHNNKKESVEASQNIESASVVGSEKVTKVTSENSSFVSSDEKNPCVNKVCPGFESEEVKLQTSEINAKVTQKPKICSSGSCERDICPKKNRTPAVEDETSKTQRCSFKERETESVTGEMVSITPKDGICVSGSCHRDICPKKSGTTGNTSQRSASEQVSSEDVGLLSKLSQFAPTEKTEEITDDIAAKYHFLLMDAATSTTSLEQKSKEMPVKKREVIVDKKPVEKPEKKPPSEPKLPIVPPVIPDNEYNLLLDEEYQIHKQPSVVSSKSSKSSKTLSQSPRDSQVSETLGAPPKTPSIGSVSRENDVEPFPKSSSPISGSVEIQPQDPLGSFSSTMRSERMSYSDKRATAPDLKIFQYSSMPPRMFDTTEEVSNELTYSPKKASNTTNENEMFESYRRASEILQIPASFPTHPALKPQSLAATPSTSSQGKPELKVRYSLTREMYHDPQHEELIAKLDELPAVDSSIRDKEAENIDAITERMKQFRKISGDENAFRRFQISNPENFEIKRVSVTESTVKDDESSTNPKRTCCGLAAAPRGKKRVGSRSSSVNEPGPKTADS